MSSLLGALVSAGLRGAISPMTLALCVALLETDKPRRNSVSYVLGYTLLHVVLGILAFFLVGLLGGAGQIPQSVTATIKMALGLLLLAFGVVAWFKARSGPEDPPPRWAQVLGSIGPVGSFGLGIVAWLNNLTTLVFYIAGLHALVSANLGFLANVALLCLLIVLVEIELVVPIVGYVLAPEWSNKKLKELRAWLIEHNRALEVGVFAIFGAWLLVDGVTGLVG